MMPRPELKCSAFERIVRFGRDPFTLLIAFIAGLGTAHILIRTATYGAAVGTDSVFFLSTAMNFLAGEGWRDSWGYPLVGWPPMQLAAFLNRRTDAPLWWAVGFTALAALTRWPGVALIGTGVLMLLPLARRKQALVFGALSSLPMLAVLAHNWAVTGDLTRATGYRTEISGISGQSLSAGLSQTVDVFREWAVPPDAPDGLADLLWLVVGGSGWPVRRSSYAPAECTATVTSLTKRPRRRISA